MKDFMIYMSFGTSVGVFISCIMILIESAIEKHKCKKKNKEKKDKE